jgi:lipopolysaccharide transport system ATP-binding protein
MSSDVVISASRLTKKFRIYDGLFYRLLHALVLGRRKYYREFAAVRDVSFEIRRGEAIGIVGRNGSGKSTLLQLICGIRKPTSGNATLRGKVSALLELGAGFHPEFTGRENVYMQGAIMGIERAEMDARMAEIVAFADIGDFLDQPVRTYSSGMFVRLAFSVAIALEPDILVVDEALSVGDEAFQRKCFSFIRSFHQRGGTILVVSHSAAVILETCTRVFLFDDGELVASGSPKPVMDQYHRLLYAPSEKRKAIVKEIRSFGSVGEPRGMDEASASQSPNFDPELVVRSTVTYESRGALISNARIVDENGNQVNVLARGGRYVYAYDVSFDETARRVRFGMLIKTRTGYELGGMSSHLPGDGVSLVEKSSCMTVKFGFFCHLLPGTYYLNAGVSGQIDGVEDFLHRVVDIAMFRVQQEPGLLVGGTVDFSSDDAVRITPMAES